MRAPLSLCKDPFRLRQPSATRTTRTRRIRPAKLSQSWFSTEGLQAASPEKTTDLTDEATGSSPQTYPHVSSCLQSTGSGSLPPTQPHWISHYLPSSPSCHYECCDGTIRGLWGQVRQEWGLGGSSLLHWSPAWSFLGSSI